MPLVGPKEMFARAYAESYAVGAFNINNMEIIQGIMQAASEEKSPVILQVSAGARKYPIITFITLVLIFKIITILKIFFLI